MYFLLAPINVFVYSIIMFLNFVHTFKCINKYYVYLGRQFYIRVSRLQRVDRSCSCRLCNLNYKILFFIFFSYNDRTDPQAICQGRK